MDLEGTYDVRFGTKTVGNVTLTRQGLYELICCRCENLGSEMTDLWVQSGALETDLGLLIPDQGALVLKKKVPSKVIGEGCPSFYLKLRQELTEEGERIDPEKPFLQLHRLPDAYLLVRGGEIRIGFRKNNE